MLKEILGPDAFARIQEVQTDPSYDPPDYDMVPLFHGGNGEVLKNVPMSKWHRVWQGRFREWLRKDLKGDVYKAGLLKRFILRHTNMALRSLRNDSPISSALKLKALSRQYSRTELQSLGRVSLALMDLGPASARSCLGLRKAHRSLRLT